MWDEVHNKGLENSETKRLTTISPTLGYHMLPPEVIEVPSSSNPFIHHLQASSMRKGFDPNFVWEEGTSRNLETYMRLLNLAWNLSCLVSNERFFETALANLE